jgi:serine-type D-Ala-D-Ala carboxypeptidase/endopeptidase
MNLRAACCFADERIAAAGERPPHKETQVYGCCVSTLTRFTRPPLQRPLTSGRESSDRRPYFVRFWGPIVKGPMIIAILCVRSLEPVVSRDFRSAMFTHSRKILFAVALLCWLSLSPFGIAKDYGAAAEASVKPYLAEHPYAAVTVGIVDAEGTHVFGFGQLKKNDPKSQPEGKTIYQIGSITKTFTTTLLAEQVLAGRMKLGDAAQKYLPAELVLPREKDREITLEELATHHSGLRSLPLVIELFTIGAGSVKDPYALLSWEQVAKMLPTMWLSSPIGSKYQYSNLAMGLLGQTIVTVTKSANYEELVTREITKPLGMPDTRIMLNDEQMARRARAHLAGGKPGVAWHFGSLEGCGALYSTVDDLLIYAAANLGLKNTPLAEAMKLAQTPRPDYPWPGGDMGLGWHEFKYHNIPMIWHNGGTGGYTSMLALLPTKKMAIVMLSNSGASIDPYTYVLIDLLFPSPTKPAAE